MAQQAAWCCQGHGRRSGAAAVERMETGPRAWLAEDAAARRRAESPRRRSTRRPGWSSRSATRRALLAVLSMALPVALALRLAAAVQDRVVEAQPEQAKGPEAAPGPRSRREGPMAAAEWEKHLQLRPGSGRDLRNETAMWP